MRTKHEYTPSHGIRGTLHHLQLHLPHGRLAPGGIRPPCALLGIEAIAIADVNSVAGVVRAWSELKKIGDEIADRAEAMRDPIGPPKPAALSPTRPAHGSTISPGFCPPVACT
jgi:hypothetical protein